jgi:ribonuclease G
MALSTSSAKFIFPLTDAERFVHLLLPLAVVSVPLPLLTPLLAKLKLGEFMAKELIISANVYEKRVALVEDGVVTEFYVERRDENQGVVGNLYKGRVMKVLPGMQSAFVDIGLERDAFLYVSDFADFMEEEEEVDFKDVNEQVQTPKPVEDKNRRGDRRDRDSSYQRPERGQPRDTSVKESSLESVQIEDVVEQLAEIADERVIPIPPSVDEFEEGTAAADIAAASQEVEEASVTFVSQPDYVRIGDLQGAETASTVYVERITDDDVALAPQEIETKQEPVDAAPETEAAEAVAEEASEEKPKRGRSRKKEAEVETAKGKGRGKKADKAEEKIVVEEAANETGKKAQAAAKRGAKKKRGSAGETTTAETVAQFERIVDEDAAHAAAAKEKPSKKDAKAAEKKAEAAEKKASTFVPEPEPEWKVGSFLSQTESAAAFQRIEDEASEAAKTDAANALNQESIASFKHISEVIPENLLEQVQEGEKLSAAEPSDAEIDREASVRDSGSREEFAMRRGGRSRRRGPQRRDQKPAVSADGQPVEESATPAAAEVVVESSVTEVAEPRREPARRPEPQRRPEHNRRPERSSQPTITDLLREGQEVLVQIAKEPIAKKGARITSHIALPGRYLVYMPTVAHIGVSRKIPNDQERLRLKRVVTALHQKENPPGGFIARTACAGISEQQLHDDMRYLIRTWSEVRKQADRTKPPTLVHRDLDLIQRILRDQLSEDFNVIRVDNELEYARIVEFVNRVQPKLVSRVKLYTGNQPIFEKYNVQPEIDKAVKPRVWLKSGGYIVINQTEALVAIDVNTGKFVGKSDKLEDTITKTNLEAAKEIVRQIRLRDLGGIIVVDFIDMEERKNRQRVMQALSEELLNDRSPSKILSINDFGLLAITRKRVKQSLERTLCTPCPYCQGGGMVKSPQTMCFEILEQTKVISEQVAGSSDVMLRVSPTVAEALHTSERQVFEEIEAYFGSPVTIESDPNLHQEQYDFAIN